MDKWYEISKPMAKAKTTKVMLYDDIGSFGKTAKDFAAELDAITTPQIDLHINSYGGEIVDGLAIYNAIKNHSAKVIVHIDGLAASIASVVAMAGTEIKIAKNAFVMIHCGWGMAIGNPEEMRKQAAVLDKLTDAIADVYAARTGKTVGECRTAMNEETWFDADEAKAWGLADEIDGEEDENNMAASVMLAVAKYQKTPSPLRKFAARLQSKTEPIQRKEKPMDKLVCREGKWYLNDVEVDVSDVVSSVKPTETVKPDEAAVAKAREDGIAAGRKAEAEYRAMFNTVVMAAKLDQVATAEFEKSFYGRAEADLKFLASHAIGQRAKAIGEGTPGNGEGQQPTDDAKADADLVITAEKRFANNMDVRRMFGLTSQTGEDDPSYLAALKRYVTRERQWAKDQKTNGTTVGSAQ